jgi:alpha-glucosidase (family GH31 glycosyl hydrolase)
MGLHNTLNIHPSIAPDDPQFAQAQATAGGTLTQSGSDYVFDWGNPSQLKAYFDLHQPLEKAGADFWWLDWCCDQSYSSLKGVTPDAWINLQYALDTSKNISRGFAFSRAYGSLQAAGYSGQQGAPTGPWADKRTTLHFTGDTTSDWQTLHFEVGYTPGESSSTGLSAVSDDIGGFNNDGTQTPGADPSSTKESDDLYVRWVQFGTFQPILRLHGNHSDRLPWQYGPAADSAAEKFLNLRENLVPYTYTLARDATATGIPVVRPTYLQYPEQQAAYDYANSEYLYGPDVLVAPATSPGTTATTTVWFPPGSSWTDYFTGKTYAGGSTAQVTTDWDEMPVFVKSGAIIATRTDDVTNDVQNPLTKVTLSVAGRANGSFSLYEDNGQTTNLSQSATTPITYNEQGGNHVLRILPARGSFTGQVTQRQWTAEFRNADQPNVVQVDGQAVPASQWSYDAASRTLTVTVPTRSVRDATVVSYR